MSCTFEIICLGNELLIGKISNSNAQWLAKNITNLGGKVKRITVVEDDSDKISHVIKETISRTPCFIITTGGLGPTFDDKTIEGIAKALGKPIELNEKALVMIKEKYHRYENTMHKKIELTPARLKMAKIPKEAVPLPNPVGTAPGVLLDVASSKIINLPGVPSEMKAIFEESVSPLIRNSIGNLSVYSKSLMVTDIIESTLAPLIDSIICRTPHVYIKSHPKAAEPIPLIELYLSTTAISKEKAKTLIEAVEKEVTALITENGGKITLP